MNKAFIRFCALIFAVYIFTKATSAQSYATETHAAMTAEAVKKSMLTGTPQSSPLIARLGLNTANPKWPFDPNGTNQDRNCSSGDIQTGRYVVLTPTPVELFGACFEGDQMKLVRDRRINYGFPATDYTIMSWMIRPPSPA